MSSTKTPRAEVDLVDQDQAKKYITINDGFLAWDALNCAIVQSRSVADPTSITPDDGDLYLIAATALDVWAGKEGQFAYWNDGEYRYYIAYAGLEIRVADEANVKLYFTGTAWTSSETALTVFWNLPTVDVASAATVDLSNPGIITSPRIRLTGSVDITAFTMPPNAMFAVSLSGGSFKITDDGDALTMQNNGQPITFHSGDSFFLFTNSVGKTTLRHAAHQDGTPISFNRRTIGDADHTFDGSDRLAVTSAAFTVPRTWTVPLSSSFPKGVPFEVVDEFGAISDTTTLSLARQGSDQINNSAGSLLLSAPFARVALYSDGVSKWTVGIVDVNIGGGGGQSAQQSKINLGINGRNYVENGEFQIWQENTTYNFSASAPGTFAADRWKTLRGAGTGTVSRQTGFSGGQYAMKTDRNSGQTGVGPRYLCQQIESAVAYQLAGKKVVISLDAKAGANYSGAAGALKAVIYHGTGVDEVFDLSALAFTTGAANSGVLAASADPTTTAARITFASYKIPSTATEVAIVIYWTPVGTAGAADSLSYTNIKFEVGTLPTAFESSHPSEVLARCKRHYQKSFLQATVPVSNAGVGTGEQKFQAGIIATGAEKSPTIAFVPTMRGIPAITLFNPAAAGAEVRDETAGATCSASAAANISDRGFQVTCTGAAGTIIGGDLGVHWVADARL